MSARRTGGDVQDRAPSAGSGTNRAAATAIGQTMTKSGLTRNDPRFPAAGMLEFDHAPATILS